VQDHPEAERWASLFAAEAIPLRSWKGDVYRLAAPKYASPQAFVDGEGARRFGSRWIPAGTARAVHAALTPEGALAESLAQHRRANIPDWQAMPLLLCGLRAETAAALDLADAAVRRALRISRRLLCDVDWRAENRAGREAPSQALGRTAYACGKIAALVVPSAVDAQLTNLVVFPARLRPGDRLEARQDGV
jgi:RES domain-containing protein